MSTPKTLTTDECHRLLDALHNTLGTPKHEPQRGNILPRSTLKGYRPYTVHTFRTALDYQGIRQDPGRTVRPGQTTSHQKTDQQVHSSSQLEQ